MRAKGSDRGKGMRDGEDERERRAGVTGERGIRN